jgi:hypothetical protein
MTEAARMARLRNPKIKEMAHLEQQVRGYDTGSTDAPSELSLLYNNDTSNIADSGVPQ